MAVRKNITSRKKGNGTQYHLPIILKLLGTILNGEKGKKIMIKKNMGKNIRELYTLSDNLYLSFEEGGGGRGKDPGEEGRAGDGKEVLPCRRVGG